MGKLFVIPFALAILLIFHTEMAAAGFLAAECIQAEHLGEFDEIRDATSMLQGLIRTLSTLDTGEWAEDTAVYEIVP